MTDPLTPVLTANWADERAWKLTNQVGRVLRSGVVEELPIDHHHRREVACCIALDVLQCDLAVLGGLVIANV